MFRNIIGISMKFFLLARPHGDPFDIFHSLHAHMKQLIIRVSLKGEKMPANERNFSDDKIKKKTYLAGDNN